MENNKSVKDPLSHLIEMIRQFNENLIEFGSAVTEIAAQFKNLEIFLESVKNEHERQGGNQYH